MGLGPIPLIMPWSDESTEQHRHKYYGPRLGFCRDVNDPAKLGRVRVHLPSMFGEENIPDHWTDWALPQSAGVNVPPLGAPVWVEFEQGFPTHPRYSHGWTIGSTAADSSVPPAAKGDLDPSWTEQKTVAAAGVGGEPGTNLVSVTIPADTARARRPVYPHNKVFQTENGSILEVDDSPDSPRLRYRHPTGLTLLIDTDGSVHLRNGGAFYFEPKGDFVIALQKGSTFKAVYPGGTGFSLGAMGFHVKGHQASILGRSVERKETNL
jgi:hypothetical protein